MSTGRRRTLVSVLVFLPLAGVAAWVAYLGSAALLAGIRAGGEDVQFALDSGAPGWLVAPLGLLLIGAALLLAWAGWLMASGRAQRGLLVGVCVVSAPALLYWAAALAAVGLEALASVLTVAPYVLLLALWQLRAHRGR